ncbi:phage protein [Brucella inopinata]|uniref:phage protein n=1 Tax=Brucella inopinata TaxID=1218315 RepID=UPI000870D249|nr:hypothetical protein [Brucella inopinata]SCD25498.1 hypothetical protein BR141012304_21039 [Brucella inopinata]
MARQWIRKCSLIVGDNNGNGLELGEFRVTFETVHWATATPGKAIIRVYNLKSETEKHVALKEFTKVILAAGYSDPGAPYGVIFSGNIIDYSRGRENPVDTYIDILASDGDQAYNYAVVSKTLAPGSTFKDQLKAVEEALKPHGVTLGYIPDLGDAKMVRSRVMHGMARDYLRTIARSTNCTWHIEQGKVNFTPNDGVKPGEAIVLNSATGLIGRPVQTMNGILARCLLNPNIRIGGQVKIDQASVNEFMGGLALTGQADPSTHTSFRPSIAEDGGYKVLQISTIGDTRGQPWYHDLVLAPVNGTQPGTVQALGYAGAI